MFANGAYSCFLVQAQCQHMQLILGILASFKNVNFYHVDIIILSDINLMNIEIIYTY